MASFSDVQGAKPKDLSDPGIAQELAAEAAEDIQTTVYETADQIATKAGRAAETISQTAKAAYDHPVEFSEYAYRSAMRFTQRRPLDALLIAGGVAFVLGALSQVGKR